MLKTFNKLEIKESFLQIVCVSLKASNSINGKTLEVLFAFENLKHVHAHYLQYYLSLYWVR